jgi:hypothetical protein
MGLAILAGVAAVGARLIYARQAGDALALEQKKFRKSRQSSLGGN